MAWYKTGTVAVTNGSTTVTGSGTNWIAGANVGEGFQGPDGEIYEITAIGSATSLTLAAGYGGSTASGVSYAIVPTHALTANLASSVADLISDYQSVVDNAGAGKFGDGSAAAPAITFTLDQDTGFFRDTANEIAVAVGGTKIGEFNSTGLNMTTAINADGGITFGDNDKAIFGAGSDLQIYHDGSGSVIHDSGTGDLAIRATNLKLQPAAGTEDFLTATTNAEVTLYYNNNAKLATTSTGIDVTGGITADGLTVDGDSLLQGNSGMASGSGTPVTLQIKDVSSGSSWVTGNVHAALDFFSSDGSGVGGGVRGRIGISANNSIGGSSSVDIQVAPTAAGTMQTALKVDPTGDISFYEDTGTTAKFFWDASAESLGIGVTSPDRALHVESSVSGASTSVAALVNPNSGVVGTGARLWLSGSNATTRGAYIDAIVQNSGNAHDLVFATSGNATSPAERLRIDSSGNVGIGTSSPSTALHVVDSGNPKITLSGSDAAYTSLLVLNAAGAGGSVISAEGGSNALIFRTSSQEAARIDSSGNLLVGTNSVTSPADGNGGTVFDLASYGRAALELGHTDTSTTYRTLIEFYSGSGSGRVGHVASNNTSTTYSTSSDYRLKTDAQPMTGASARVQALNPVNFEWIADGTRVDGFLAHEAQEVVPEAVTGTKDAVDADGNPEYQGIDQSKLVPLLTAALQEALTEIADLKARVTTLEG